MGSRRRKFCIECRINLRSLQTYVWQNYDLFPNFPALKDFLSFWQQKLEGPLFSVTVAHSKLIKPAELHAVDGVFRLH